MSGDLAPGRAPYSGTHVLVAGAGVAGAGAISGLLRLGARVSVFDDRAELSGLATAGAHPVDAVPADTDLVVASPGFRLSHPLFVAARERGVESIGEVELAWRLRGDRPAPWLAVTGTNGKTTTAGMCAAILAADGRRVVAAGNVGHSMVDAVLEEPAYDVIVVELSSAQLAWSTSLAPAAAVVLNLAPDHLDWHGSYPAYAKAKAKVYDRAGVCLVASAGGAVPPPVGARTVRLRSDRPDAGEIGVAAGQILDRAFDPTGADLGSERAGTALAPTDAVRPAGPHNVDNAIAAAGLARSVGVAAASVAGGLAGFRPAPHRNATVATVGGVRYVDDSKATNPHAALASLRSYDRVVWIAGGLLKGAEVDDLVAAVADRLVAAVLLGADREAIADAIARHAPDLPVTAVDRRDDEAMAEAVAAASRSARPGDTVLLAPAAASWDMFANYGARGDAFVASVRAMGRGE